MKYTTSVIRGKGRGKGIGYPTFNLKIPKEFPHKPGIYACWVWIENIKYTGAMHFGPIPTFDETALSLEIFVLGYSSADPIKSLTFTPVKYLRPIKTFTSPEKLSQQISLDVSQVRQLLATSY